MTSAVPAGPPSIRTDWLADLAWRLAGFGLERWRTIDTDQVSITDVVDGERWELTPSIWSTPFDAVFEFDGDLRQPADGEHPSLRLGGTITPFYDDDQGRALRVRIEIGPRGPVTFDPENWLYTFPLTALEAGDRPAVNGLTAGAIEPGRPGVRSPRVVVEPASLDRAGAVWLGDLVELAEGRRSWFTALGVAETVWRPRRFGFGAKRLADPFAAIALEAEGDLRITSADLLTAHDFAEVQGLASLELERDRVAVTLAGGAADGRTITISGAGLQVTVNALTGTLSSH